ncbi:MAG: transglycosylase SLT domain-containing protein [Chromatiales bacterium]|nr:transglycosylase SLT domain-containing protein [Gammaproteobacteria bacterium]MBW6476766.1 transglycosylase SLT domain-containing protein [Chromatiales bacterium]
MGKAWLRLTGLLCAGLMVCSGNLFAATSETSPRAHFLTVKQSLEQGEATPVQAIASLKDYPLYPYLLFWQLQSSLDGQDSGTIQTFLDAHAEMPLATQLRVAWLRYLAGAERWEDYLGFYQGSNSADLRCHAHTAQLHSKQQAAAWRGAAELWLVGNAQHRACDALFAAWEADGQISTVLRWQRIELAMAAGNADLALSLATGLREAEQAEVALWHTVHQDPQGLAEADFLPAKGPRRAAIALHGIKRLASSEPEQAAELWPLLASRYAFDSQQRDEAAHAIALYLALRGNLRALEWYAVLEPHSFNQSSRGWVVRAALRHKRWLAALTWIEEMPAAERDSEMWSYWRARALEGLGRQAEAELLYRQLSTARSYYGFLAADRIGAEYNLNHRDLDLEPAVITRLESHPAVLRAAELLAVGMREEARREWSHALGRMSREERLAAGSLAARWAWHDRALLSLAHAGHFDDLAIRFPLAYAESFFSQARQHDLDPAWIYAVARQESAMDPHARSRVGAMGLMQLMPATGEAIARQLETDISDRNSLLDPELNIRFGSHYLSQMLARFEHPVLATAAYNAGPHRVERWYPPQASMDADIWVDTMPFHETREYVRRVMAYAVFYDQRLERPVQRLSERMQAISKPVLVIATTDRAGEAQ